MKKRKILPVIALSIILPSSAILPRQAFASVNNVRVSSDRVRVTTYNGNINVSTGKTTVSVPNNRHSTWYPGRYWRIPGRSNCQRSYLQTTQLSSSGKKIVQHSSTDGCR